MDRLTSLLVRGSIFVNGKVSAFLDVSLLGVKTTTTIRNALDELLLGLFTMLVVVFGEIFCHARLLPVVLANEDWLHAELVKSLQVATARLALLVRDRTSTTNL